MKYWAGYVTAAILGAIALALGRLADRYTTLVDMVYPYVTRTVQDVLAQWSGTVPFCLWQVAVMLLLIFIVAMLVLVIVMHWNPIRFFGWVLAAASLLYLGNTLVYGLNYYAGSIATDIRMQVYQYTVDELTDAAEYYQGEANALASQMNRDENGDLVYSDFETLAQQAGSGFETLVRTRSFSVLGGSNLPVKELGWSGMYTAMGTTGVTVGLTGEAAVNTNIPAVSMPFTICREMAHRKCIATEGDSNFAAFLACQANDNINYRYSGYFMAYRYCLSQLKGLDMASAKDIMAQEIPQLSHDMESYSKFFASRKNDKATELADTVNDTYLKANGDEKGIESYNDVCGMLVNWYIQEILMPTYTEAEVVFDPFDESQVDLSGITNAVIVETEPTEPVGGVG